MTQYHITLNQMKHNLPPHTLEAGSPERLEREKKWDIATGELLQNGADWEKLTEPSKPTMGIRLKQLGITQAQYEKMHKTHINDPDREEFTEKTVEDQLIKQLDELREGLSETDKVALWWYATANYYEMNSARKNMSLSLQRDRERLDKAREVMRRLQEIRRQSS